MAYEEKWNDKKPRTAATSGDVAGSGRSPSSQLSRDWSCRWQSSRWITLALYCAAANSVKQPFERASAQLIAPRASGCGEYPMLDVYRATGFGEVAAPPSGGGKGRPARTLFGHPS
jgi:hypothetical protein